MYGTIQMKWNEIESHTLHNWPSKMTRKQIMKSMWQSNGVAKWFRVAVCLKARMGNCSRQQDINSFSVRIRWQLDTHSISSQSPSSTSYTFEVRIPKIPAAVRRFSIDQIHIAFLWCFYCLLAFDLLLRIFDWSTMHGMWDIESLFVSSAPAHWH